MTSVKEKKAGNSAEQPKLIRGGPKKKKDDELSK